MKFSDIKQLTRSDHYRVNVSWTYLQNCIDRYCRYEGAAALDMNPDFQRGHVWTEEQQIAYVELKLRGGEGSNIVYFNCSRI